MPSRQLAGPPIPAHAVRAHAHAHAHAHRYHRPLLLHLEAAAAAVSIVLAAALAVMLYRRCRRSRTAAAPTDDPKPAASLLRRFTYAQLRRATGGFAPSHRLGQGGFGPVFRGALPSGQEVAVKLMDSGSLQGEREFQNELSLGEKILAEPSPDRKWVVAPLGFCISEEKPSRWWRPWRKDAGEEEEEDVMSRRLLLVYELMHNGSLQDALLDRRCAELADWARRFSVAVDIARGLQFLHAESDPPVVHGDIKPSNILLDACLSAHIADFGLARVKTSLVADDASPAPQLDEEEAVVEIDLDKKKEAVVVLPPTEVSNRSRGGGGGGGEDDASVMGETVAESTTTTYLEEASGCVAATFKSPEDDEPTTGVPEAEEMAASPVETAVALEVASTSETGAFDGMSIDSGKDIAASGSRRGGRKKTSVLSSKDWWWRQDTGGGVNSESGGSVKDYVMEWIKSEIKKERPKSDWITTPAVAAEDCLPKPLAKPDRKKQQRRLEWWASLDEEMLKKEKRSRPAREWWREEFCEELTNKHKRRMMTKSNSNAERAAQKWWQKDDDGLSPSEKKKKKNKRSWSRGSRTSMDRWTDSLNGEVRTTGRRSSRDWASGDIPKSGTVSSTPSMRGTVCYVAPEYGGGGPLSEKCDIYSFGVLLLVLISGRRPLQVTASPMSEFERANLISWARHLAHLGRLLDLVDPSLRAADREQVLLCITVALLCIQRSPTRRPSIKEIVGMLTGQSEPPNLPLEFSPSPPGGYSFKSRKKAMR